MKSITTTTYILFAMALLFFSSSQAQEVKLWNLKQCIDHALANNIQIKQSKLNIDLASENLLQSKASALPSVNAFASHNYNFGRTVDPFTNDFVTERIQSNSFSISGNVTLFNGLKTLNTIKQNQYDFQASKYDADKVINDMTLAVAGSYLQILFEKELKGIAKTQVEITKEQVERTKKLVKAGIQARGNLLDIEAQYSMDELNLVEAENRLDMAYLNLAQLLDLEYDKSFDIADPQITLDEQTSVMGTAGQVYTAALSVQPQIKSAGEKLKSAEKGVAIAKGQISPTLSLGGSYGTGYSDARKSITGTSLDYSALGFTSSGDSVYLPNYVYTYGTTSFGDQINDNVNQSIGFNLSIPIFNGFQTKAKIGRAKIAFKNAEYSMALEKLKLKEDIQRAYLDAVASLKKYRVSEKSVQSLEESFNHSKQRFDVGMATSVDFNDSKNKLARAKSDLLQAKYDYIYKTKILEFYQGRALIF